MYQRKARAGAFLGGDRVSGQDIRDQNGMFLTSWGPNEGCLNVL
jgi:hypothetical protein